MKGTNGLVKIALMLTVLIVSSLISIYVGNVPITLQVFAVALAGYLLGYRGLVVVGAYLIIGMIGVPIFSGFGAGVASLVGPSGGYLIGFVVLVFGCGLSKDKPIWLVVVSSVVALVIFYAFGIAGYTLSTGVDLGLGILANIWYLPKDVVLMILAYVLAKRIENIIKE
jgi:biotin transport system substrate-specific component